MTSLGPAALAGPALASLSLAKKVLTTLPPGLGARRAPPFRPCYYLPTSSPGVLSPGVFANIPNLGSLVLESNNLGGVAQRRICWGAGADAADPD